MHAAQQANDTDGNQINGNDVFEQAPTYCLFVIETPGDVIGLGAFEGLFAGAGSEIIVCAGRHATVDLYHCPAFCTQCVRGKLLGARRVRIRNPDLDAARHRVIGRCNLHMNK